MAKIYKTNGSVVSVKPENGKDFTLEELKSIVSGYIEVICLGDEYMVINEEGKNLRLAYNERATSIFRSYMRGSDYIVGDALVCSIDEIK